MRKSVTVTGPPFLTWSLKTGTTLPRLPRTFPNRTAANCVFPGSFRFVTIISATRLVAPMTFGGLTALSVDIMTNFSTFAALAASATFLVPKILFFTAS